MTGELRECACGRTYTLPLPYDAANPEIRDLCPTGGGWKHRDGPNPCRFVRDEIIDADDALKDTPFADVEPFDPEKFISDVIGS